MTQPPLFDRAVIADLSKYIGAESARSVLTLFGVESRAYLAAIAEAGAQPSDPGRRERARMAAHSLKGCAGQIGAAALAAAALAVESSAAVGAPNLAQAAASLHQCAEDTMQALREFLAE
jgi:HPt (histidine-containing phosphotransfer) domain-containing protein